MNFAFLWMDTLAITVLWVAMLAAIIGRIKRRWLRGTLACIIFAVPLFPLGMFLFFATEMKFSIRVVPDWFVYALLLLLAHLLGAFLVLYRARFSKRLEAPAAASWPRGTLVFAWLTAIAFGYITLMNMDLAVRARCTALSAEENSLYFATLPAITFDAQNAAPLYEKAFARLKDDQKLEETVENPPTGNHEKFDPDERATIAFLATQDATVALLRQAAALPACRFDADLQVQEMRVVLLNLNAMRNAANVLSLHAREEIAHGHVSSAIADAAAIIGMSRHIGQRPTLVSALVGIGIAAIGDKTLEEALPSVTRQEELAPLHLQEVPSMGRTFQQALRGEERYGLLLYGNATANEETKSGTGSAGQNSPMLSNTGIRGAFFRTFVLDLDTYVQLLSRCQNAAVQPYYVIADSVSHVFGLDRSSGLMTSIIGPSFARVFKTVALVEANDAYARTAIAMTRFRVDHGRLPPSLTDLVPQYLDAVPLDPSNGRPIRLVRQGDRSTLCGGGRTGKYEGDIDLTLPGTAITFDVGPARGVGPTSRQ